MSEEPTIATCERYPDQTSVDFYHGQDPAAFADAPVTVTLTGGRLPAQHFDTKMQYTPEGDGPCACPAGAAAVIDLSPP